MDVRRGRTLVTALLTGALVSAGIALAPQATAATTVLTAYPVADTYTSSTATTTNYGAATYVQTKAGSAVGFVRFTLPTFPAGTTLTAASLRIRTTSDPSSPSAAVQTFRITTDTWTENGLTWSTMPSLTGTALGTLSGTSVKNTQYTATLATAPLATLSGKTLSLAIVSSTTDGLWFGSRTAGSTSARPLLSLTFTSATDLTPPTAPGGLTPSVSGSTVSLTWLASTDDVGVTAYDVHRSTSQGFTPTAATLIATTSGLSWSDLAVPVGTWFYAVVARDAAGHSSPPSTTVVAIVSPPADSSPPTQVTGLGGTVTGSSVALTWTAATDDVGVTAYDVHRSSNATFTPSAATLVGSTPQTAYTDLSVPAGTWYYRVVARDAAGNSGPASATYLASVVPPPDTSAPTVPTGVVAIVSGTSVSLSWTASSDDVAVAGYEVHRSTVSGFTPTSATRLGTTTSTTWPDTGLAAGTYFYRVVAYDAVPNASAPSVQATATVTTTSGDVTPPTAPTGVTVSPAGTSPRLSWLASSDDTGVAAYELHRSTSPGFTPTASTKVGTTASTALDDPTVPAGTWYYRVVALDAAGNRSLPSDPLTVAITGGTPVTLSVDPTADTYSNSSAPTTNFGTSASLAVRGGLYVAWLRYLLPAKPGTTPLASVTLRFRTSSDVNAPSVDTETLMFASDSWSETTLTWSNQPSPTGPVAGTIAPASGLSAPQTASLDPTAFATRLGTQVTLAATGSGTDGLWLWSRNQSTAAYHPWLDLTFASPVVADVTPPSVPTGLVGSGAPSTAHIAWAAGTDATGIASYEVDASTDSTFPAASTTTVVGIPRTSFDDHNRAIGTYWYRVRSVDGSGNRSGWSTPISVQITSTATDITVVAAGDLVCAPGTATTTTTCRHRDVAAMVAATDPDWFMPLGDIQYESGIYADFMSPSGYNGAFAEFLPRTLPVIGNHEYIDPSSPGGGYFHYFDPAGTGQFGANPDAYYTRVLSPSWRLIVINSECSMGIENAQHMLAGGCAVGSPEYTWLQSVLQSSTQKCTLAAFHRPRWSTGTLSTNPSAYPEMAPIWDLLAQYGVDVAVSGHKHGSEVFAPIGISATGDPVASATGIRQFVAGAGGKNFGSFDPISGTIGSLVQARDDTTFGGLKLVLHDGSYDWSFVPVAGQVFTNAGTTGAFSATNVPCS